MVDTLSNQNVVAEPMVVREHMAVDLLTNIDAARRLAPFLRSDQTLGSAAAELKMPASSLAYWVARFQKAGLVKVVRHEPRAGKPIPIYRATSAEYHVPLDALPPGRRDEFLNGGRRHMFDEFTRSVDVVVEKYLRRGLRIRSGGERGVEIGFIDADAPGPVPATESWSTVTLTEAEAREVQMALEELTERYVNSSSAGEGRREYVMMLGLVPKPRR